MICELPEEGGFFCPFSGKLFHLAQKLIKEGEGGNGASAFMEDYTYHLEKGNEYSLGAHMLEVCPSKERGLDPKAVPGVICASHGPFTWGKDAAQAVYHAVVMEEVAKMARLTLSVKPSAVPAPQHVQDKHYMRKHGPNAYYGQKK